MLSFLKLETCEKDLYSGIRPRTSRTVLNLQILIAYTKITRSNGKSRKTRDCRLNGRTSSGNIFDSRDSLELLTRCLPFPSQLHPFDRFVSISKKEGGTHCCVEIVRNYDNSWAGLAELMKTRAEEGRRGARKGGRNVGEEEGSANRDKY